MATLDEARAAKVRFREAIGALADSVSIGLTQLGEDYALKVNVTDASVDRSALPSSIDGVKVVVESVGTVRGPRPIQ